MPGSIQVSVLGLIDVQTSSSSSSNTSLKVAMGELEYRTSDSGDYIFPVTRLRENLIITLLDVNGNGILHREIETRMIIENGFMEEKLSFNGYGNVQLKMQFVLSEEDRNRIRFLRQSVLSKKHDELVNRSSFTKSKSMASDLSSLSPLKTEYTGAAVSLETNLSLSQDTEPRSNAEVEPVSSSLITWKPEVKDTAEKTTNRTSSSGVTSSKKLKEVKRSDIVSKVKQDAKVFNKPETKFKRKSMRRSMSETNLSNVRKMISTFEIKVSQDTKLRTSKIPTDSFKDVQEKTNAQSQPTNAEKLEEQKEKTIFTKDNSVEQSTRRSDLLSKQRRKHSSVVEGKNEKKPNNSACLRDSQLENARGSRLWIFPDEAKELSFETNFGTRHLDLAEENLLQKKTDESNNENIGERGSRCRSIAKMNRNNKWKNIERSKNHKSETSADSESSRGPVGQVMRGLIVVGFASLVLLTRQRT